jgi:hypothetical protein
LSLFTIACTDWERSKYRTAQQAELEGAFNSGWLPTVIRSSAVTSIEEQHNIDTNFGWGTFRYSDAFAGEMERKCTRARLDERGVVRGAEYAKLQLKPEQKVYRCQGNTGEFFIVLEVHGRGSGFFWHNAY